jgi:hypothetical protein
MQRYHFSGSEVGTGLSCGLQLTAPLRRPKRDSSKWGRRTIPRRSAQVYAPKATNLFELDIDTLIRHSADKCPHMLRIPT